MLAEFDTVVIAAGLFLKLNDIVYYKYNASDPVYLVKKNPNHLLTWKAIKQASLDVVMVFLTLDAPRFRIMV